MITRYLSILFLFSSLTSLAQFQEDFSESLTNPHPWQGDSSYFRINADKQLQSNGPAASGKIFLQTYSNALAGASWSFWLNLNFESSTSNYTKVFLAASSTNLLDPQLEAYYLKIGGLSGSKDGIDLYYQKGTLQTLVAKGKEGHAAGNPVTLRIKVLRDHLDKWEVYADTLGGENFQLESTGTYPAIFASEAFGFLCVHSSTRRNNFYFDDLKIDGGFVDLEAPQLVSQVYQREQNGWLLFFNEALNPLSVPVFQIEENAFSFPFQWITEKSLLIQDTSSFIEEGTAWVAQLTGIRDRAGNMKIETMQLIKPKMLQKRDVVINELLFNPFSYGVDFIELYNVSPWYVECNGTKIKNQSGEEVLLPPMLMEPGVYLILTKDSNAVMDFYPLSVAGAFMPINLPVLPDDEGEVIWLNEANDSIDFFHYNQSMHHPLLESKEGVSLERVNARDPSQWTNNWQSASTSSGGATPGYANSQAESGEVGGWLSIEPHSISPGTDGYRNYANIRYALPKPGGSLRMDIFSLQGNWICSLQPSGPSDARGMCTWNGTDASLQPVSTGLYLVVAEFFHPDGEHLKIKDTISVLLR
ncbi:MAG: lamin tail domain-containing protein [Cytophagaceae bacterium]|nr:lamin tail domain-containing protein [Cytophagaceae bacterium]